MRPVILLFAFILCAIEINAEDPQKKNYALDDVAQFVTPIAAPTLGLTGIRSKHPLKERLAVTITALGIDEILVQTLKHTIHSTRPDMSDNKSFPSGHNSLSFAGAEIMREEYGWWIGGAAYLWSVGVGALRIHHHRHRFIDVAGGAAAGIISARLAYLLLPLERKIFGWSEKNTLVTFMPYVGKNSISGNINIYF